MHSIIVADGDVRPSAALDAALAEARAAGALVVGADGGALKANSLGLQPSVVVGDLDSLAPEAADELRAAGATVIVHRADKDASDTELAVDEALARGATSLTIVGAFGGRRVEHSIANLLLLALPQLRGRDVALIDGPSVVRLLAATSGDPEASLAISGAVGDLVSLLPLSTAVSGVTTSGLRFPLTDATLRMGSTRGLSNELVALDAAIGMKDGLLAVIHTHSEAMK